MHLNKGNNKCFVIMPYGSGNEYKGGKEESAFIYNCIIKASVTSLNKEFENKIENKKNLLVELEAEIGEPRSITDDIVRKLATSEICIADLTGKNPNVFLELGIRFSLRNKNTILMIQESSIFPSDLRPFWYIKYNPFKLSEAKATLIRALRSIYYDKNILDKSIDSPVFQTFPDMRVAIPSLNLISCNDTKGLNEAELYDNWGKWQKNAEKIRKFLTIPIADLHFNPTAVLCISHGRLNGLFTGSILTYGIFNKTKVLSLWGSRDNPNMFDNRVNKQMLQGLRNEVGRKKITLLLIDYKVESGETASQAIKFVTDVLGKDTDIVFCPMFCRNREAFENKELILNGENNKLLSDFLPFNYKNKAGRGFDIVEDYFYDIICAGDNIPKHPFDTN